VYDFVANGKPLVKTSENSTIGGVTLPASGWRWVGGTLANVGVDGIYWVSTGIYVSSNYYAYRWKYDGSVAPYGTMNSEYGYSVRCIRN
jgi:hypothetical protein